MIPSHGPLVRHVKLQVVHAPGMQGMFSPSPRVSDSAMHHGTCVMHVPWCMPGAVFYENGGGEKHSRHSRRMRNPHFTYLVRGPWDRALHCTVQMPCWRWWVHGEKWIICTNSYSQLHGGFSYISNEDLKFASNYRPSLVKEMHQTQSHK